MSRLRRIKSFNGFSEELQERNPRLVVVQADCRPARGLFSTFMTGSVGHLGDFQHGLFYTVSAAKRQRNYIEPIFTAFQSEYGFADHLERNKRTMQLLLAGEVRIDLLKTALPEADVYLAGPNPLQPMAEQELELLHEQAQEYDVVAPTFVV